MEKHANWGKMEKIVTGIALGILKNIPGQHAADMNSKEARRWVFIKGSLLLCMVQVSRTEGCSYKLASFLAS